MMKNKTNPLEELRREKEIVRREVAESEARLGDRWSHLSDNAVPLLLNAAVHGIAGMFGFGHRSERKDARQIEGAEGSGGIFQTVFNSLVTYYPLIWEVAQPMIIRFVINRIKSLFTRKKKRKRKDDDD
ncbi:MAG: hypothetical protein ACK5KT_01485 [Dysgonomonas sp.]